MTISLRRATIEDFGQFKRLKALTNRHHAILFPEVFQLTEFPALEDRFRALLDNTDVYVCMAEAERWALSQGVDEIQLTVWEGNSEAVHFYDRLGYQTQRRVLQRRLSAAS